MDQGTVNRPKMPIFIGCTNPEVIKDIDDFVKSKVFLAGTEFDKENFELAVIAPSIQERLQYQYLLTLLNTENQTQIIQQRNDNVKQAEARKSAFQLRDIIEAVFYKDYSFDRADIKTAVEKTRGRMSTNQVGNLVEFLSIYDFIQPIDLNEKPHKRKWRFNFSPQDSFNNTVALQNELNEKITLLQTQVDLLEDNKVIFQQQMDEEDVDDEYEIVKEEEPKSDLDQMRSALTHGMCDTAKEVLHVVDEDTGEVIEIEAKMSEGTLQTMVGQECKADGTEHVLQVEEPVKKKRGRPKKELPADPGEHDSDCKCSAHRKGKTETEKYLDEETKKER
jgi:hypothetical protein